MINSRKISSEISKLIQKNPDFASQYISRLISLYKEKNNSAQLNIILKKIYQNISAQKQRDKLNIVSPFILSLDSKEKIKELTKYSGCDVEEKIDLSLIGGFKAEVGFKTFDGSISGALDTLNSKIISKLSENI